MREVHAAKKLLLRGFIYAAFISIFINLSALIGPLFMIEVYNRVIPTKSYDTLYGLLVVAGLGIVVMALLDFVRAYTYEIMGRSFAQKLNLPALQAGVMKSVEGGIGEGAQAIRNIADLRQFISSSAISLPLDALWSVIFVFVLYMLHPLYGNMALGLIVVMIALNALTDRLTRSPIKEANAAQTRHINEVGASLRHAEAIEAMGMLPALVRGWRTSQNVMLDLSETANVRARILLAVSRALQKSIQIVTVTTGAILVLRGEVSSGVLFAAMILTTQALQPFSSLIETWRQWVTAAEAWGRTRTLLEGASSLRQTMPVAAGDGDLVIDRLVYLPAGRDIPVLRGLSFKVSPGEVLGIVGPSGAGKSTLARSLVGVIKPTAGGVYLDGTSTWLWERGSFGRAVGYLPQSLSLIDGTVRQTIARMEDSDPREVIRAARTADIHELIGRLPHGYDTPIREGLHMLSGGQMQRLALARALYGYPKLLILDEPNSNLDHVGERALVEAVEAAKARGTIVVMIAHRPSVMACADKILVLQDGQITQFGPRTEVIDVIAPDGRASATKGRTGNVHVIAPRGDGK